MLFYRFKSWYRLQAKKSPFIYVGLPFLSSVLLVWSCLIPISQVKFNRRDEQVKSLSRDAELDIIKRRRKVDVNEEYYVSKVLILFYNI